MIGKDIQGKCKPKKKTGLATLIAVKVIIRAKRKRANEIRKLKTIKNCKNWGEKTLKFLLFASNMTVYLELMIKLAHMRKHFIKVTELKLVCTYILIYMFIIC